MENEHSNFSTHDLGKIAEQVKSLESQLADLGSIMQRIEAGSYGTCTSCGDPLTLDDLKAAPTQNLCSMHRPTGEDLV